MKKMSFKFLNTSFVKKNKSLIFILLDILYLTVIIYLFDLLVVTNAYFLLDGYTNYSYQAVLVTAFLSNYISGLYKTSLRSSSISIIRFYLLASLMSGIIFFYINYFFHQNINDLSKLSILISSFILTGLLFFRYLMKHFILFNTSFDLTPVIICGSGEAKLRVLSFLSHSTRYKLVAMFHVDKSEKLITTNRIKDYPLSSLSSVCKKYSCKTIILLDDNKTFLHIRRIIDKTSVNSVDVKIIDDVDSIFSKSILANSIREIKPEELLPRININNESNSLLPNIREKTVMITGAGGSIGSELCKQVLKNRPKMLIMIDSSEFALYQINEAFKEQKFCKVVPILGSILDKKFLSKIMLDNKIDTIFHAAAYKHVPLIEENVLSGIENNVFGTLNLVKLAIKYDVTSFTLISSDKAVRPANIMGATKRISELIVQTYQNQNKSTVFSIVRFGNVLGSSGSVIPLFLKQIEEGGPVTITHSEITRYFMTISEAAMLVLRANNLSKGAEVFLLDMGNAIKILDLAKDMISLKGFKYQIIKNSDKVLISETEKDPKKIAIIFTGLRKGEKLHEELLVDKNQTITTKEDKIFMVSERFIELSKLTTLLQKLSFHLNNSDSINCKKLLYKFPIEFEKNYENIDNIKINAKSAKLIAKN